MPRHTLRPNSDTVQAAAHPLRPHPVDNEYFTAGYVYETHDFLMAAAHFPLGVTVPPKFDPQADPTSGSPARTFRPPSRASPKSARSSTS